MSTPLCGAPKTRSEGTCRHEAGWGTQHPGYGRCKLHGGAAPSHLKHAQKLLAADRLHRLEGELADHLEAVVPDYDDPIEGLLEAVARTGAMMRMAGDRVGLLEDDELDGERHITELYERWTTLHQRACKAALDAGVAERRVRLAEEQAELVAGLVREVIGSLDIPEEDKREAERKMAREFRLLEGGQAA